MTLLELFRFLVPYFATVSDADVLAALAMAEPYRPECLTAAQQDQAQVYYAAWLLYQKQLQTEALTGNAGPMPARGVTMEKEGDLQRQYGSSFDAGDPFGWWDQFAKLAALCGGGAITVGHRHGSPCGCHY